MTITEKNVIYKALSDPKFGKEVFHQLPLSAFTEGVTRDLVQIIKRYYVKHSKGLDLDTLMALTEEHAERRNVSDEQADELYNKVNQSYEVSEDTNEEVAEESVQRFVRRELSIAVLQDTLNNSNIEEEGVIENLSDKLREISVIDAMGNEAGDVDFFEDYEKRLEMYDKKNEETYPTGFQNLDQLLKGGGLSRGQLAVLIAGTGTGKTTAMVHILNNAVKSGLNAMYISLEEHPDKLTARLETNLIGKSESYYQTPVGDIDREKYEAIDTFYQQNLERGEWGRMYIRTRLPYKSTVEDIEQMIRDVKIKRGQELDLVVVDYPEIMKKRSAAMTRDEDLLAETFHRIRGLAEQYGFIAWAVSQTNRSAGEADVVTAYNIQGGYKVTNSADLVLTMNRKKEEKKYNCFRMNIDKIREPEPTAIMPDFLYFKTLVNNGYQIIPETDTEIAAHKALISDNNYTSNHEEQVGTQYGRAMTDVNDNLSFG